MGKQVVRKYIPYLLLCEFYQINTERKEDNVV